MANPNQKKSVSATEKAAEKVADNTIRSISAVESKVATPEQMVHAGTEAVRDFIAAGTQEAQKTQEKVLSLGRESVENWSKAADQATRTLTQAFSISKDQFDALMESGKIVSDLGREFHEQLVAETNALFSENVELSKDLLACRTLNDLVEIQKRVVQNNVSRILDQSARLTETWFRFSTEAAEPLSTQASKTSRHLSKTLAA